MCRVSGRAMSAIPYRRDLLERRPHPAPVVTLARRRHGTLPGAIRWQPQVVRPRRLPQRHRGAHARNDACAHRQPRRAHQHVHRAVAPQLAIEGNDSKHFTIYK